MTITQFRPGHKMSPPACHTNEFTEALRYLMMRPAGPKGFLGRPKKCTMVQSMVITVINKAAKGDLAALVFIWERIEGKLGQAGTAEPLRERPDISLKEVARRVGYLLLSQQPDDEP